MEGQRELADALAEAELVPGWMDRDELAWLANAARALPEGGTWVEVGTWRGRSFTAVALSAPAGSRVVAVDTWRGSAGEKAHEGNAPAMALGAFGLQLAWLRDLRPDVELTMMRKESLEAAALLPLGSLDAVFLDGAHDYASVLGDINAWRARLRPHGLLCGHDLRSGFPGVQRALEASGTAYERGAGSIWVRRR